jgi:hypothetical protein
VVDDRAQPPGQPGEGGQVAAAQLGHRRRVDREDARQAGQAVRRRAAVPGGDRAGRGELVDQLDRGEQAGVLVPV